MEAAATPTSRAASAAGPYVGLRFYTEADASWFFGRDDETQTIIGNLTATRLTILYAKSGVGKSSLLRAGVAHQLHEIAEHLTARGSTGYLPVVFSTWSDDSVEGLIGEIEAAVGPERTGNGSPLPRDLRSAIAAASAAADAELLVILDQFEEYLLYQDEKAGHSLVDELAACVNAPETPASFLIAIRDDGYASLGNLFAGKIPNVYSNFLELKALDRAAAERTIVEPIERCNQLYPHDQRIEIEPELVEAVLAGVSVEGSDAERVTPVRDDGDSSVVGSARDEIEAPYLQLVMSTLWERERARGSRVLRVRTLGELGGAKEIVRTHLDGELDALPPEEYDTALDVFGYLVTPSGSKIALTASDLAESVGRPHDRVLALLRFLAREDKRIVRHVPPPVGKSKPDDRYEIFHDVLGPPIADWRRRALEKRRRAEDARERERLEREKREAEERSLAEAQKRRAFQRLAGVSIALLAIAVALAILALISRHSAVSNLEAARANQIVAGSERALSQDPELSMLLALRAIHLKYSEQAETALRESLPELEELEYIDTGSAVNSASFSRDGREILIATDAGAAIVDPTGRRQRPLRGHAGPVNSAAFSKDGTKIVTADKDGTAIIWNAATGKLVRELPRSAEEVESAAFSPDGTKVVTANKDGSAIVWEAATDKSIATLTIPGHIGAFDSAVFSPDGTKVLTANEGGTVNVWSAETGQRLMVLHGHVGSVESAAFSPDGARIASVGADGTLRIWDAATGRQLLAVSGLEGAMLGAAFSPDGNEIVTAGQDRTARVWDVETGKQLLTLSGDRGPVRSAAFSSNGREIVTAGEDGTIRIWDASPRERLALLPGDQQAVIDASFDPSGARVITANQNATATIWDVATGARLRQLHGDTAPVYTAEFSPDGKLALTASRDGSARIWSAENGRDLKTLRSEKGYLDSAHFNPGGNEVVTASSAGVVKIWSTTGRPLHVLSTGAGSAEDAIFSPTGSQVASANENGTVTTWPLGSTARKTELNVSSVAVLSVAFNPAGTELLTAGKDGIARIWKLGERRPLLTLASEGGPIYNAEFSRDGREVVTADEDGEIRIWNARTGKQLALIGAHEGVLLSAAFSADDDEVLTGSAAGDAAIWSTELAQPLADVERIATRRVTRGLTTEERQSYLPR
jgi:WD40 repeat protein